MNEESQIASNRPYGPPANVIAVLHRLRQRNMPERIDADFLRDISVSEGTITRTLYGLRFLKLIADETPTAALRSIATATDEEYSAILSGLLRDAYQELFQTIDPAEEGQDRILNFFRRYTPGSQRQRMVIFFLGMCREAGITTMDAPRQRATTASLSVKAGQTKPKVMRLKAGPQKERPADQQERPGAQGVLFSVTEDDAAVLEPDEFAALWSALGKLAYARGRAKKQAPLPMGDADEEPEIEAEG